MGHRESSVSSVLTLGARSWFFMAAPVAPWKQTAQARDPEINLRAAINVKDSKSRFQMDIGFLIATVLWLRNDGLPAAHVN